MEETFTNSKNRTWLIDVTISTLRRIRDLAKIDLGDITALTNGTATGKLSSDPILLTDVLYAACQPDIERKGVSRDDFCDSIMGDTVNEAAFALLEALSDFFPSQQGILLKEVLRLVREDMEKDNERVAELIKEGALEQALQSGTSRPDAPES